VSSNCHIKHLVYSKPFWRALMKYLQHSLIIASVIFVSGCQSLDSSEPTKKEASIAIEQVENKITNNNLFEVHKDGRIYVFYDFSAYKEFLKLGHTPFVLTKIGVGPKGETLVYSLTSDDKKKREGIVSVDMMEGRLVPSEDFYAEMNMEGRTYVFSRLEDMSDVRKLGESPYRHAKIGYGANGETVVFVLNGTNKKLYPEALVKKFDDLNK
jgi:hypothetical protein